VLVQDVLPALTVEMLHLTQAHVCVDNLLSSINFLLGDNNTLKVTLQKVLETEEANLRKLTAAGLKI
jgi:hypothetical protein